MKAWSKLFIAMGAAGLIAGCGTEGGSGGTGSSGTVSRGTITSTGNSSITVNGVTWNTSNANITVDDGNGNGLSTGQVVTVFGTMSDDNNGNANSVDYDEELEGPITGAVAVNGTVATFTLLGTTVHADSTTTVYQGMAHADLAEGVWIEVSGFYDVNGDLMATFIELEDDDDGSVEMRGIVEGFDPGTGNFMLGNMSIQVDGNTQYEDLPGGVANGVLVEVEGTLLDATTILAEEVEGEDSMDDHDGADVEVEGVVSGFTSLDANFFVGGTEVDGRNAILEPADLMIADGMRLEAEGHISNGVLVAEELKEHHAGGDDSD